jgi:uncharacterized repeat protein (TIGR02543 family)
MLFKKSNASVSSILYFLYILAIILLFTACSSDEPISYRVFFEPNGGQHEAGEYVVTGRTVYQPGDPYKAGAVFKGWFADAALTRPYNFYSKVSKDLSLYAKWLPSDGGSGDGSGTGTGNGTGSGSGSGSGAGSGTSGGSGTGTGSGGDNGSGGDGSGTGGTSGGDGGNTVDRGVATISFDSRGGSAILPRTVHIGDALNMDPDEIPTRHGATFEGWYTDDGTPYVFSSTNTVTGDITLHAKWEITEHPRPTEPSEPPIFIVSFETNGGSPVPDESVRSGSRVTQPSIPTKTGLFFDGWYTNDGAYYDFSTPVTENITLYAKWVNPVTVNFDTNGGSTISDQVISYDPNIKVTVDKPLDPTKSGRKFVGWYTDNETFSKPYDFSEPLTARITLYAKWVLDYMVWVPEGSFKMGSLPTDSDIDDDEKPQHDVTITKGYYMAKYEVSQALFKSVMGYNPSVVSTADSSLPVETVSWYEAVEFCNKLSEQEGLTPVYTLSNKTSDTTHPIANMRVTVDWNKNGYRLPTEAEWEYAAKGGNGSLGNYKYSGGDNPDLVAWYSVTSGNTTHPVETTPNGIGNGLGIFNMSGNVWEWCWDQHSMSYSSNPVSDPKGPGGNTVNNSSGGTRVMRGGCYSSLATITRSANRLNHVPNYTVDVSGNSEYQGFRIVCNGH